MPKGSGPFGCRCQALLQRRGGQASLNVGARDLSRGGGGQAPLNVGARRLNGGGGVRPLWKKGPGAFCGRRCLTPFSDHIFVTPFSEVPDPFSFSEVPDPFLEGRQNGGGICENRLKYLILC